MSRLFPLSTVLVLTLHPVFPTSIHHPHYHMYTLPLPTPFITFLTIQPTPFPLQAICHSHTTCTGSAIWPILSYNRNGTCLHIGPIPRLTTAMETLNTN